MFENLGPAELLLIFIVIMIFFGPKKIPELAASLGKGLRKFNEAKDGFEQQVKTVMKEPIDAITDARDGLHAKLLDASAPLRDPLFPAAATAAPATTPSVQPTLFVPTESLARGSEIIPAGAISSESGSTPSSVPQPPVLQPPVAPTEPLNAVPPKEA